MSLEEALQELNQAAASIASIAKSEDGPKTVEATPEEFVRHITAEVNLLKQAEGTEDFEPRLAYVTSLAALAKNFEGRPGSTISFQSYNPPGVVHPKTENRTLGQNQEKGTSHGSATPDAVSGAGSAPSGSALVPASAGPGGGFSGHFAKALDNLTEVIRDLAKSTGVDDDETTETETTEPESESETETTETETTEPESTDSETVTKAEIDLMDDLAFPSDMNDDRKREPDMFFGFDAGSDVAKRHSK